RPGGPRPERGGQWCDRCGGPSGEDHLVVGFGPDEPGNGPARGFVGTRGRLAQEMHPAMHIAVLGRIVVRESIDDALRLLRGRGIVEVYEGTAIHLLLQSRKLSADPLDIETGAGRRGLRTDDPSLCCIHGFPRTDSYQPNRSVTRSSSSRRTGSSFTVSMTSPANACSSMPRARFSEMPRDRR